MKGLFIFLLLGFHCFSQDKNCLPEVLESLTYIPASVKTDQINRRLSIGLEVLKKNTENLGIIKARNRYYMKSLRYFLQDKHLIPKGAEVHVIGSGDVFYQWLVFLLFRPDIKVVISEINPDLIIKQINSSHYIDKMWRSLTDVNPALLERSGVTSKEDLVSTLKTRLSIVGPLTKTGYNLSQPKMIGSEFKTPFQADLIFSLYPYDIPGISVKNPLLKKGGIIWIVTESLKRTGMNNEILNLPKANTLYLPNTDNPIASLLVAPSPPYALKQIDKKMADGKGATYDNRGSIPSLFHLTNNVYFFVKP